MFEFQRFRIFPLASPSRHLRLVGDRRQRRTRSRRTKYRHGSARARRLTRLFAPAPLQSLQPCIPPQDSLASCLASAHSAANRRDSQDTNRARPKIQDSKGRDAPHVGQVAIWPRDFIRPRHQQYGARLRLSPRTSNRAARLRHGQDERNNREIGHFRTASISQATLQRTETTELTGKTNLVRDPAAGLRSLLSRIALVAINPASIPLRSIGGDSEMHHRLRGGIGMKDCFRGGTQHTLSVRSFLPP
jgi:hypothetical protein